MNWDFGMIADIAATLGIVISTLTLISAYSLYRIGKRDDYIKNIRNILMSFQYNCKNLDQLINYEISHELITNVIYSKQIDRTLTKLYSKCFSDEHGKELLEAEFEQFYPITTSVHSELLRQYDDILKNNTQEASKVYTDYPSLYRVYETVNCIFGQTMRLSKQMARDEDMCKELIMLAFDERENISNVDDLKDFMFFTFMGIIQKKQIDSDQKDIDDILDILTLTTNALMRLDDKKLYKHKKKEKGIHFKEINSTDTIFEDLLEAEKGLRLLLTEEELLQFREFSTKIKVRGEQ